MQVDYLFLIPLMPAEKLDAQRAALRELCFNQLRKLGASYRVWLLGDMEEEIAGFEIIKVKGVSKEDKLWEAGKILEAGYTPPAKYVVRLDDDDLINPEVFDTVASGAFDCCTDRYHTFYDLSSGKVSSQKRDWFPNTVIHRYKHAMQKVQAQGGSALAGENNFLFACGHSQTWHSYYADKIVKYTQKENPLYVRVLNPRSITAQKTSHDEYAGYLSGFGSWRSPLPFKNTVLKKELKAIWFRENDSFKEYEFPKKSLLKRMAKRIIK